MLRGGGGGAYAAKPCSRSSTPWSSSSTAIDVSKPPYLSAAPRRSSSSAPRASSSASRRFFSACTAAISSSSPMAPPPPAALRQRSPYCLATGFARADAVAARGVTRDPPATPTDCSSGGCVLCVPGASRRALVTCVGTPHTWSGGAFSHLGHVPALAGDTCFPCDAVCLTPSKAPHAGCPDCLCLAAWQGTMEWRSTGITVSTRARPCRRWWSVSCALEGGWARPTLYLVRELLHPEPHRPRVPRARQEQPAAAHNYLA